MQKGSGTRGVTSVSSSSATPVESVEFYFVREFDSNGKVSVNAATRSLVEAGNIGDQPS
jgi:hypothetical protein